MVDPIDAIFTNAREQQILNKRNAGMQDYYGGVKDGTKASITCYPAGFSFDSRIKTYNTVVLKRLEERKKELDSDPPRELEATKNVVQTLANQTKQREFQGKDIKAEIDNSPKIPQQRKWELKERFEDTKYYKQDEVKSVIDQISKDQELASITNFLKVIKPQDSERAVFDRILDLFSNERGVILHSLTTDVYLQPFVEEARIFRKKTNPSFALTPQEERISKAMNLTDDDLNRTSDDLLKALRAKNVKPSYTGQDINNSLKECKNIHKSLKKVIKGKFNIKKAYDEQFIKDSLKLYTYQYESRFPGELDLLSVLPDLQLFMHVEVKCNMEETKKNDNNLKDASEQMERYSSYIAQRHGPVLGDTWEYLKVAAILPNVTKPDKICNHCKQFLLTEQTLKNETSMRSWWEKVGIWQNNDQDITTKTHSYNEFLLFFNRTVNLSSIVRKMVSFNAWEEVQGQGRPPIVAGFTEAPTSSATSDPLSIDDVSSRPHDAFKALYFTPGQMALLATRAFNRIILFADYGAGE